MLETIARSRSRTAAGSVVSLALALWWWAIVVSNYPLHLLERLRHRVSPFTILIPNWRFFAPAPAEHDVHLVYRTRSLAGKVSDWCDASKFTPRQWWRFFVSPGRRQGKAQFDVAAGLATLLERYAVEVVRNTSRYRQLETFVARAISVDESVAPSVDGFQFGLVRAAGYDETVEPEFLMVSAYTKLRRD